MDDVNLIENPLKSGACAECGNHYRRPDGKDICCENHIGILTRMCAKIPICKLYRRSYSVGGVGAPDSEVVAELLSKFEYHPERADDILKKYDSMMKE